MKPAGKPVPGIFATQDPVIHQTLKRPVANAYSLSALVSFESRVDSTMEVFCTQLKERFVDKQQVCDLGKWLQMFAFDVIGELTFSKRLGFLESGEDVNGVMAGIWNTFKQTSLVRITPHVLFVSVLLVEPSVVVPRALLHILTNNCTQATQMPWLDYVWINNPIKRFLRGKGVSPGAAFAMARVQERRQALLIEKSKDWNDTSRDFLSRFLEIEEKESVPPYAVAAWAGSNITAGSDTTGIYLRTLFHELLTHPESRDRLRRELDTAASQGSLSILATWGETSKLPYLDACIKEAGRLHPPFALPYERVVPAGGASLCGARVGEGTVVGMSAWAVHRDEELFGADSDRWRPERWLEVGPERKREMENGLLMVRYS
jgi:hypothetical protein